MCVFVECVTEGGWCRTGAGKWVVGKSRGERVCAAERNQAQSQRASWLQEAAAAEGRGHWLRRWRGRRWWRGSRVRGVRGMSDLCECGSRVWEWERRGGRCQASPQTVSPMHDSQFQQVWRWVLFSLCLTEAEAIAAQSYVTLTSYIRYKPSLYFENAVGVKFHTQN